MKKALNRRQVLQQQLMLLNNECQRRFNLVTGHIYATACEGRDK
jgi:hypothetical protein